MAHLHPFYLLGDVVWRSALVALPLLAALALYLIRSRGLARNARARRSALPKLARLDAIRGALPVEAVLEGVVVGAPGARVFGWSGAAGEAEGALSLRVDGEELAITGPIEIVVGGRESMGDRASRIARHLRLPLSLEATAEQPCARVIGPGDRVIVHARVARDGEASTYRESRAPLVLEPLADAGVVRVAASRAPRLVAFPLRSWAAGAGAGLFLWITVFVGGGTFLLRETGGESARSDDGLHVSTLALAALTPQRRPALRALAERLAADLDAPERVRRAERLFDLLGDCNGLVDLDLRRGDLERAAERSYSCGVDRTADLFFATGHLTWASRAYKRERGGLGSMGDVRPILRRAVVHLAAHAWSESAEEVRAYDSALVEAAPERREALRCVADAIEARGGRWGVGGLLREAADRRAMCRVLAANLAGEDQRRELLRLGGAAWSDGAAMEFAHRTVTRVRQALIEEIGAEGQLPDDAYQYELYPEAYVASDDLAEIERRDRAGLHEHPFAIFAAMHASGRGDGRDRPAMRVHVLGHLALFLAATGEDRGARAVLARLDGVPAAPEAASYWRRPTAGQLDRVVTELASERPYHAKGVLYVALDAAIDRAREKRPFDEGQRLTIERLRNALLDREIAVPLLMLEAFGRR